MISVEYGAKRPLKFEPFIIDSPEKHFLFSTVDAFVCREMTLDTWMSLDDVKKCKLLEKIAIMFCKEEAPTREYGVTKAEIRDGIIQVIDIRRRGGGSQWLSKYGSYQSNPLSITADSSPCETKPEPSIHFITARRSPRSSYAGSHR